LLAVLEVSLHSELEFFNSLTIHLEIELDDPATTPGNLLNLVAPSGASITRLEASAAVWNDETDESRELTAAEFDAVAFRGATLWLKSDLADGVVHHTAPNGEFFTVRELLRAIEETERTTRPGSDWQSAIDVHHVYFDGLDSVDGGVWEVSWGS
jgi:hypothetical protein